MTGADSDNECYGQSPGPSATWTEAFGGDAPGYPISEEQLLAQYGLVRGALVSIDGCHDGQIAWYSVCAP